ncbi:NAD(P)/FAD-dependent oxidoreductase [Nocardioides carbamazepini]|uniref:NAD(P)/FAD-dependent oxidoreductase n=1 Tax=Nocardioides carbamazepini TaxID=2854259 RepID=UPI00214A0A95|nr:NAD(P)/FAD-dependent oxidoreductase [Nocardioides carbamazepini]MCR1784201.1 NAD(P)/FAD-dependent oxidoreductase [Nocardioides carbamazepini]
MDVYDAVVIGAGQAGLSASFHLARLGVDHVVLDADDGPGGAWQHRWDSLSMHDVHGVADLPDAPAPGDSADRANVVLPAWFGDYERTHRLPVVRPVRVDEVHGDGDLLVVRAGRRSWTTRTLVNATGTWTRPFLPYYPGAETFRGEQLHTADYPGPEHFAGRRVVVVGGGASAVQFLGELAPRADVVWVTRRPPVWRDHFDENAGRHAIELVQERVRAGLPPASVVSVTGLALRPQEQEAARLGVYERRRSMFARIEPDGVRWADGAFERADVILWATGFRPAVGHLAPLRLRSEHGGIALLQSGADVQTATTALRDPRVQLVGYGPSASTIGGNRAGRAAALAVRRYLVEHPLEIADDRALA